MVQAPFTSKYTALAAIYSKRAEQNTVVRLVTP